MQMQRRMLSAVATGAALVASMGANKAAREGWRKTHHGEEPPTDPAAEKVPWRQAVMWVLISSLAIALAKLVASRAAAAGVKRMQHQPPASSRYH